MWTTAARVHEGPDLHSGAVHSAPAKTHAQKLDYRDADPTKWKFEAKVYSGSYTFTDLGEKEVVKGQSIDEGVVRLKADPSRYVAIQYQTEMREAPWPADQHVYHLYHREGTKGLKPTGIGSGPFTMVMAEYQRLPPLADLGSHKDPHTDQMAYEGFCLHAPHNPPISPGRGQGVCDVPNLKIIGDVDPWDVAQGGVGNCWLLSAISSLAEFDMAVERLFRKTADLKHMPKDAPNTYTITLWDLPTGTEVDVVIDERLAVKPNGSLLGCQPSEDGELWVCYLEKAIAVHCGGWDAIEGGQCPHAWRLLTGCKLQYTIKQEGNGKYKCYGTYNPNEGRWEHHENSPRDPKNFRALWPMEWPEVGSEGGGGRERHLELSPEDLFERMCHWDDHNFIMGAGSKAGSDKRRTKGIVDGHAYSVIECKSDVAGTGVDLIKMRNPHGQGEIEGGDWGDHGPGWKKYPQVEQAIRPVFADDGVFWLSVREFVEHFPSVYVCAKDMTEFISPRRQSIEPVEIS